MEILEMLDSLKQKALEDKKLREEFLETRKSAYPCLLFVKNAGNLGILFMRWN